LLVYDVGYGCAGKFNRGIGWLIISGEGANGSRVVAVDKYLVHIDVNIFVIGIKKRYTSLKPSEPIMGSSPSPNALHSG
jgi:hypothetical protein